MKYKNILSIITGATLIGAALFLNSASEKTAEVQVIDYFAGDPIGVFELDSDDAPKGIAKFKQAASKAGVTFSDAEARSSARTVSYLDEKGDATRHFEYNADKGYLSFNKGISKQIMNNAAKLPDEKTSESLAKKFLTDNGLMPAKGDQLKLEHVGGIKRVSSKDKKEYDVMKTVTYSRTIDGVPVVGEGSKIIVELGDKGEVMAVTRKWRETKSTGANKMAAPDLKSQAEAESEFGKIVASQFGPKATSRVNTISKLYLDSDGTYLQPVYLMAAKIKIKTPEGQEIERDFIQPVSMLKKAPEAVPGSLDDLNKAKSQAKIKSIQNGKQDNPFDSGAPKRQ